MSKEVVERYIDDQRNRWWPGSSVLAMGIHLPGWNQEISAEFLIKKKVPSANDWWQLFKNVPVERVDLDENGHYDPKKSPNFDNWMRNG